MDTQRRFVILDGSNIVSQTKDANRTDGRILLSAIEFYEALGYTVIPVMYSGTIGYMKKNNHTGAETLAKMAKSKSIITFTEGDDEGVIQIGLRRNGWIVTYDTFSHAKKDKAGNKIPPEREKYTHWDWDDIDERTRGTEKLSDGRVVSKKHWKVDGIDFHDPLMPKAPKELLSDEYTQVRRDLQVANRRFDRISVFLGEAETGELNKAMKKEMRKIRGSMTRLSRMIPVNQLPKDATIDNLLASECKQLIRLINQIDENANLALSGNVNEP